MAKKKKKKSDRKRNLKYGEVFSERSKKAQKIPASAGMTKGGAGMTKGGAGMTGGEAGMTPLRQDFAGQAKEGGQKEALNDTGQDREFRKELKRNLTFIGIFLLLLLALYFVLTKTNLLNPVLQVIGLEGIY